MIGLTEGIRRLKNRLLREEVEEELGGDRGWKPVSQMAGLAQLPSRGTGRDSKTGGPLLDIPFNLPKNIDLLTPPPSALKVYESGQVWDLSVDIRQVLEKKQAKGIILALTLGHCHWSDRAQAALERSEELWGKKNACVIARAGDRLAKVYFRDIRLGEVNFNIPTFPFVFRMVVDGGSMRLHALSMDPLGPDPSFSKIKGLIKGENQVPRGSDHFEVYLSKGTETLRLSRENDFSLPLSFVI